MKSILFNTDMALSILDGKKTVIRRLIRPQPVGASHIIDYDEVTNTFDFMCGNGGEGGIFLDWVESVKAPYRPGDILYARETWYYETAWEDQTAGEPDTPSGRYQHRYVFKASSPNYPVDRWRPAIHMPKEAARIFLRVMDVRAERLPDILEDPTGWQNAIKTADSDIYDWDANTWVWVIEFERISDEEARADEKL